MTDTSGLRRVRSVTTRGAYMSPEAAQALEPAVPMPEIPSHVLSATRDARAIGAQPSASATEVLKTGKEVRLPVADTNNGRYRRSSHDAKLTSSERMFVIDVAETEQRILAQEDTDGDFQITVKDMGPKAMALGSAASGGFRRYDVRGTYVLSNLLQELARAKDSGRRFIVVAESALNENPVARLSRTISTHFWAGLTRAIDRKGLQVICQDPKNRSHDQSYKIYVPYEDHIGQAYYRQVMATTDWGLQVHVLPPNPSPEYVKTLDEHPGILSLALYRTDLHTLMSQPTSPTSPASAAAATVATATIDVSGMGDGTSGPWRGVPFIVPGGRFNEMYGWDSYFETLGLVVDGRWDMGKHMVDNFCYQIHHYGKILNANRSYYLTRSQPPFLTDMARAVTQHWTAPNQAVSGGIDHHAVAHFGDPVAWLRRVLLFAVREYYTVWTAAPRWHAGSGLSVYHTTGIGMPPETESSHFTHILEPYAVKHGIPVTRYAEMYAMQALSEPELDEYFKHDRAVRESGHDTTYRLEKRCADLLTVDLNALLHKYEMDIAEMIELVGVLDATSTSDSTATRRRVPVPVAWRSLSGVLAHDALDEELSERAKPDGAVAVTPDLPTALGAEFADLFTPDMARTSVPAPLRATDDCVWESSEAWRRRAERRKRAMTDLQWNPDAGMFVDYDFKQQQQSPYESVTTLWTLWAGVATPEQASVQVHQALPKFEELGGLVAGSEESRGSISLDRPSRQWDYPFGWAPHQMLAWTGLARYGYKAEAVRLAYRWLYTITKAFVDFNGTVPEKFDVVSLNHILTVEYGNVGTDFKCVPREGFGWMNASVRRLFCWRTVDTDTFI
ncbi:trehalase-domain-containing protein [Blastocladiella britannica]|nr:trehalase-domain-containing protein [Blastocladiella britannica]